MNQSNNMPTPHHNMHNETSSDTDYYSESEDESPKGISTSNPECHNETPTSSTYLQKPKL